MFYNIKQLAMLSLSRSLKSLKSCYSTLKDQINFTPAFYAALNKKLQTKPLQQFLRLQIAAGQGCEGFTYKFRFDNELKDCDFVHTNSEKRVIFALGDEQVKMLKGSIIDYISEMMREVFYVKENPNAEISCSCKTSFSPKEFLI